jgi:hypothetical protein
VLLRARDWRGVIPREHGSWAYVIGPQIAAVVAAPRVAPALGWAGASLLLFAAFQAFAAAQRRKERASAAGSILGAAGLGLAVVLVTPRPTVLLTLAPALFPAALGLLSRHGRMARDRALEITGILAASIQAGGGLLLGGGTLPQAALLAVSASSYFLLSLIWIRVRLGSEIAGRAPLLRGGWNLPASLALLLGSATAGLALGAPAAGLMPGLYLARILLPVPRRPDGRLGIPRLGVQEAILAALFTVGLGLFLRA